METIIFLGLGFIITFILLDVFISPVFSNLFTLIFLFWVLARFEQFSTLAIFYLLMGLVVLGFSIARPRILGLSNVEAKGNKWIRLLISLGIGISIFIFLYALGSKAGNIMGTPSLAIASSDVNILNKISLASIENRFFLLIWEGLMLIGPAIFAVSAILSWAAEAAWIIVAPLVAALFATFHNIAALGWGFFIFAALFFLLVIIVYTFVERDDLGGILAHFLHNFRAGLHDIGFRIL